jgi:hypothetical protein
VPGVPHLAVRELAFDPHFEELLFEPRADAAGEFRDGVDAALRCGRRCARRLFRQAGPLAFWFGLGLRFLEREVE